MKNFTGFLKRGLAATLAALSCFSFASCGGGDGFEEIRKGIAAYSELRSAYVEIQNAASNRLAGHFIFRVDGDSFTYYNMYQDGDKVRFEHHDGKKFSYGALGDSKWSESYIGNDYKSYSRLERHPNALGSFIFFQPEKTSGSSVITLGKTVQVQLEYNTDGLSGLPEFLPKGGLSGLSALSETILINNGGNIERINFRGTADGKEFNYEVAISNMNGVGEITRPDFPGN